MAYEPDWKEVGKRMRALTLKELKPIMEWFIGCFEGATTKNRRIEVMVGQMRHWWNRVEGGKDRARKVLEELYLAEERSDGVWHPR